MAKLEVDKQFFALASRGGNFPFTSEIMCIIHYKVVREGKAILIQSPCPDWDLNCLHYPDTVPSAYCSKTVFSSCLFSLIYYCIHFPLILLTIQLSFKCEHNLFYMYFPDDEKRNEFKDCSQEFIIVQSPFYNTTAHLHCLLELVFTVGDNSKKNTGKQMNILLWRYKIALRKKKKKETKNTHKNYFSDSTFNLFIKICILLRQIDHMLTSI